MILSTGVVRLTEKDRELNDPSDARVKKSIDIILGKDTNENGESFRLDICRRTET